MSKNNKTFEISSAVVASTAAGGGIYKILENAYKNNISENIDILSNVIRELSQLAEDRSKDIRHEVSENIKDVRWLCNNMYIQNEEGRSTEVLKESFKHFPWVVSEKELGSDIIKDYVYTNYDKGLEHTILPYHVDQISHYEGINARTNAPENKFSEQLENAKDELQKWKDTGNYKITIKDATLIIGGAMAIGALSAFAIHHFRKDENDEIPDTKIDTREVNHNNVIDTNKAFLNR